MLFSQASVPARTTAHMFNAPAFSAHDDGRHPERGFSGSEFTICLIVLGLAMALALKGAAAVDLIRTYVLVQQIQSYRSAVNQYLIDLRTLPGDDADAPQRWGRQPSLYLVNNATVSFAGSGQIDGDLDDPGSPLGEQYLAWQDLRYVSYVDGDRTLVGQSARPENMFGGVFGFAADQFGLNQVLCLTKVPGHIAAAIDRKLDDGLVSAGLVRATSQWDPEGKHNHFTAPDSAPYDPDKTYIICVPYLP